MKVITILIHMAKDVPAVIIAGTGTVIVAITIKTHKQ